MSIIMPTPQLCIAYDVMHYESRFSISPFFFFCHSNLDTDIKFCILLLVFYTVTSINTAPAIMILHDHNETCDDLCEAWPPHW